MTPEERKNKAVGELAEILGRLSWAIRQDQEEAELGWVTFSFRNESLPSASCVARKPASGWSRRGNFDVSDDGVARAVIEKRYSDGFTTKGAVYYRWTQKGAKMPEIFFVEVGRIDLQSYWMLGLQPNQVPVKGAEDRERFIFYSMEEVPDVLDRIGTARRNYFAKL